MPDDLAKLLRHVEANGTGYPGLYEKAADCIEALETALREIEMLHYDSETDFYHDAMKAHDIARAALGEKKDG